MQKQIAIVLNTSWNVYNFRLSLLKKLQQKNYAITVIAPYDIYSKKLQDEGFNYINLKLNNDGTNIFQELKLLLQLFFIYKKNRPDIILHYTIKPNLYGTFSAMLLNIPSISNISGLGTIFLKKKLVYKFAQLLYKGILRFPKKVFFQNSHDHQLFLKNHLVSLKNSETIPGSGINTNKFKPIYQDKNIKFTFLMVARLIKDKGVIEYIEAAKIVKKQSSNTHFQLIGELYLGNPTAITEDELQQWIEDGTIEYLGTSDQMNEIISKADCIVLPSYREGLSRVLLEASSMEKPIITTNVPGCKDVVEDEVNGLLCKVKSSQDLAIKMNKMLSLSEEKRVKMGQVGREKIIAKFDEKIVIDKYLETIEEILTKKNKKFNK